MIFCIGVRRKTVPPKNLQKEWLKGLPLRAPRGHPSASHECATTPLCERNSTKRLGKMSAMSALPPPPLRLLYEEERSFALTEAGVGGRRPRRAFEDFWRKTLMEGPSQEIFKTGGWLCLTDALRYYTTLQFWQVTGSAGVYPGYLTRFWPYLVSYAGCGRDARGPRAICNNLGCTPLTGRFKLG